MNEKELCSIVKELDKSNIEAWWKTKKGLFGRIKGYELIFILSPLPLLEDLERLYTICWTTDNMIKEGKDKIIEGIKEYFIKDKTEYVDKIPV